MLARLGSWIKDFTEDEAAAPAGDAEWAQTLAGLLVEAAMADGELDSDERRQIARVLHGQLELGEATVGKMIEDALASHEARVEIHGLTRAIRAETEPEDRVAIMEMAWMVVLADGELHDYEAQLMRRLAGLLYVDDIDSGRAARRARARLA
ncbi:MAG: TerB family tellurite resistance protein [Pseudomonadota bacterium]|nr:TerB family tellurite resistance protein [Pseudomonadota bacterium]MEC8673192.1 TerB family tellurite resistance protein [Pseudomonadota bacterium]